MGRPGDGERERLADGEREPPGNGERERLTRVFGAYGQDAGRRRAWEAENPGNRAIRDELARAVLRAIGRDESTSGRLLDAGCGSGWWLARLAAEGVDPSRLIGVDLLALRVEAAAQRVPQARMLAGDIRRLPLEDQSCAVVTLFTVLSGMPRAADVDAALAEARRVLAPAGMIAIWEPRVPTPSRDTRLIRLGDLRRALGPELEVSSLTVLPPLARRAGRAYGRLAALPVLRTHRLVVARPS